MPVGACNWASQLSMRSASAAICTQSRSLRKRLARTPLRAQHADVGVGKLLLIIQQRGQDMGVLLKAVGHQHGRIGWQQSEGVRCPGRSSIFSARTSSAAANRSLRCQVRAAIGNRDKPAQFARQSKQRLGVISRAENPKPGRAAR